MNSPEIKEFIRENKDLFWHMKEAEKENISHEALVESILNYGDEKSVKRLFEILGIDRVADIFYKQTHKENRVGIERSNYFKRTAHFFNLYFKRHVPKYPL